MIPTAHDLLDAAGHEDLARRFSEMRPPRVLVSTMLDRARIARAAERTDRPLWHAP